jgi:predicted cobalt transporter CbtA
MAIVIIGFALIALFDLPYIIRQKQKRILIIYSVVFIAVLSLAVMLGLGVKLPSSMLVIGDFMKKVLHLSY